MADPTFTLTMLANLSAHRRLLIYLFGMSLGTAADPVEAARELREKFRQNPTKAPPAGTPLPPAVSDHVAAMTDEAIDELLAQVQERVRTTRSSRP